MRDYPQNTHQWAEEAFHALVPAWDYLLENNPFPSEKQKEKLIELATEMACENRDINDKKFKKHAHEYVDEVFQNDLKHRDIDQKINFSLCFVLAYFDAHLSLSMITQEAADDVIALLKKDYDLSYEGKTQSNVFNINYTGKA